MYTNNLSAFDIAAWFKSVGDWFVWLWGVVSTWVLGFIANPMKVITEDTITFAIVAGSILLVLILIIVLIACGCKKRKKKKLAKLAAKKAEEASAVEEPSVIEETPAIEEKPVAVEEKPAVVEEKPVVVEEKPAPAVEEKKAEVEVVTIKDEPEVEVVTIKDEPVAEEKPAPVAPAKKAEPAKTVKVGLKKNSPTAFSAAVNAQQPIAPAPKKEEKTEQPAAKTAKTPRMPAPKKEKAVENNPTVKEEKTMAKTEEAKTVEPVEKTSTRRYAGKWKIKEVGEKEFAAFLYANNGQVLLTSEIYASASGAKGGIATISKNVAEDRFEVHSDKNGHYYYKVKTTNNRLLCVGETYSTRAACMSSVDSVKNFCSNAVIVDEIEKDITMVKYIAHDEIPVPEGKAYAGKWTIEQIEEYYMAKLYASNGQLLLVGESYKLYDSAKGNIDVICTNALANNFIIDKDKNGRYYYKLRNEKKSILCVGEAYSELAAVESAIESVKRFVKTAKLADNN